MAQTTHPVLFGPIFVVTAPPITYFIDYNYIHTINISWFQKKNKEKKKKNSLMTQTTPDVLFVPGFITATPPAAYFVHYNYIYTINVSQFKKIRKKKKTTHLLPKRHQMRCLGLYYAIHSCSLSLILVSIEEKKYDKKKYTCGSRCDLS